MDELRFWKFHGTGNDFVMIEDLADQRPLDPALVAALCHRRFGAGADGVIRVTRAEGADFFMDYRNADGTLAEMCGNGIRCLGKLVYEHGLTEQTQLEVLTRDGRRRITLHVADRVVNRVTVDMGRPAFDRGTIPMSGGEDQTFLQEPVEANGRTLVGSAVSMGNPHLVLFLDEDPAEVDVGVIGPALERASLFPERTNVEFVQPGGRGLKARVWERGVGETMACGTGACAAFVAASEAGLVGRRGSVLFPGGPLDVEWAQTGEVLLTGAAERVYEGVVEPEWLISRMETAG